MLRGKIKMGTSISRYDTYEECLGTLRRLKARDSTVLPILEHEKAHFEKALELGYNPQYGIHMIVDCPPAILAGFVDFKGRVPEGQDMMDILLAPEQPGEDDLKLVEEIKGEGK